MFFELPQEMIIHSHILLFFALEMREFTENQFVKIQQFTFVEYTVSEHLFDVFCSVFLLSELACCCNLLISESIFDKIYLSYFVMDPIYEVFICFRFSVFVLLYPATKCLNSLFKLSFYFLL